MTRFVRRCDTSEDVNFPATIITSQIGLSVFQPVAHQISRVEEYLSPLKQLYDDCGRQPDQYLPGIFYLEFKWMMDDESNFHNK